MMSATTGFSSFLISMYGFLSLSSSAGCSILVSFELIHIHFIYCRCLIDRLLSFMRFCLLIFSSLRFCVPSSVSFLFPLCAVMWKTIQHFIGKIKSFVSFFRFCCFIVSFVWSFNRESKKTREKIQSKDGNYE